MALRSHPDVLWPEQGGTKDVINLRMIIVSCRDFVRITRDIAVKHLSKELPGLKNVLKQ